MEILPEGILVYDEERYAYNYYQQNEKDIQLKQQ